MDYVPAASRNTNNKLWRRERERHKERGRERDRKGEVERTSERMMSRDEELL